MVTVSLPRRRAVGTGNVVLLTVPRAFVRLVMLPGVVENGGSTLSRMPRTEIVPASGACLPRAVNSTTALSMTEFCGICSPRKMMPSAKPRSVSAISIVELSRNTWSLVRSSSASSRSPPTWRTTSSTVQPCPGPNCCSSKSTFRRAANDGSPSWA